MQNLVNIGVTKEKEDASLAALNSEKSKAAANLAEAIAVKEKSINDLNNAEERYGIHFRNLASKGVFLFIFLNGVTFAFSNFDIRYYFIFARRTL